MKGCGFLSFAKNMGENMRKKGSKNFTKISWTSPQNGSETFQSDRKHTRFDKEIPKERYMFPEER